MNTLSCSMNNPIDNIHEYPHSWAPWSLYRRHKQRDSISFIGHCHHVSTLCPPDVATHDQISQAFPSIYAYCKRSKTRGGISLAIRPVSIHKAASTLLVVQDTGDRPMRNICSDITPHVSTLHLPWVTAHHQISWAYSCSSKPLMRV